MFEAKHQGTRAGVGGGFFFTSDHDVAKEIYAWRDGDRVVGVFLSMQNPLDFESYFLQTGKDRSAEVGFDAPVNYFDNHWEEVVSFAKANGYDGIMWPADPDSEMRHDLLVAFEPEQIRFAYAGEALREVDRPKG